MEDLDENSARFVKITRRSSLTIGLRNITNKTVMFKVHSNPRAGPNYPLSGLLLPGEQNNHKINKMYDLDHLSKYLPYARHYNPRFVYFLACIFVLLDYQLLT